MRVTIGDLDYYYAAEKRNCFNTDVMKISSYHKQLGDKINFVQKEDDIYRPYDIYYIIKEDAKTPNPPFEFFVNNKVKWGGEAVKFRINWQMDNVMLAVRPDYLLYPEKETKGERAEQVRLLGNEGKLLPIVQDGHNAFTNKRVLVTDTKLWTTDTETTIKALKQLEEIKNLSFLEPIWLHKLASDKNILDQFLKLKLSPGSKITGVPIFVEDYAESAAVWEKINKTYPNVKLGPIMLRYRPLEHWLSKNKALQEGKNIQSCIINSKQHKISVELKQLKYRTDTPYFLLFETVSTWLHFKPQYSGLEWITTEYGPGLKFGRNTLFWSHTEKWNEVFRDLLRQTGRDTNFLLMQGGNKRLSENDIPGTFGEQEFKYEI